MILSESEKERIRGLHREASPIKEPLNEWTDIINAGKALYDVGSSSVESGVKMAKKIYDKLDSTTKDLVKKATTGGLPKEAVKAVSDWAEKSSGKEYSGDESTLESMIDNVVNAASLVATKGLGGAYRHYQQKSAEEQKKKRAGEPYQAPALPGLNEQDEEPMGGDPVAYIITKLTDKIKDVGEFITGGTDVSELKDVIKKAVDEVMNKEEEVLKRKIEESRLN